MTEQTLTKTNLKARLNTCSTQMTHGERRRKRLLHLNKSLAVQRKTLTRYLLQACSMNTAAEQLTSLNLDNLDVRINLLKNNPQMSPQTYLNKKKFIEQ